MVFVTFLALLLKYWRNMTWVLKNIQINGKISMEQTENFSELSYWSHAKIDDFLVLCDRFS